MKIYERAILIFLVLLGIIVNPNGSSITPYFAQEYQTTRQAIGAAKEISSTNTGDDYI